MTTPSPPLAPDPSIPSTLRHGAAGPFWLALVLTGSGTGVAAAALTRLLEAVEHLCWRGSGEDLVRAAASAGPWRHVAILIGAGLVTGVGQTLLRRLASGNAIDTTAAIWFHHGRLPALRTLGSAALSVIAVGMGASLGREGAPKAAGAVLANTFSDRAGLSDDQRRLLVACGAGAGMAAAYGVPLGGALFALEVLRGALALRTVVPALFTSTIATAASWIALPDARTYPIPAYMGSLSVMVWAVLAGPIAGVAAVGWIRLVHWADRNRPGAGLQRLVAPVVALGVVGVVSIAAPEVLGNGSGLALRAFTGSVHPGMLLLLLVFRPAATILCVRGGIPGGLFTPSLTLGALLGAALGGAWSWLWPGSPPGLFAVLGAGAVLAATTQGPISAVVLLTEMTGQGHSFLVPLVLVVGTATLVARTLEPRSIYDARLADADVAARLEWREAQWAGRS